MGGSPLFLVEAPPIFGMFTFTGNASFGKGSSCVLTRLIVDNGWSSELKIFSEVAL